MLREEKSNDTFGCGFNKRKYAGDAKLCRELGLDFTIHCMGPERIKRSLKRKYDIEVDIEGKDRFDVTREAQAIIYG
ncbi:hypothetical protein [uncultured Desulfosarcina sp.]|uniref:hypothetical protein n=1 Tax=uncultured Desulfosarcina sp. TaxID=218289 RepID=UPI0029C6A50A|nr:hypothetical protein [uncultured Desulfosarcina sp.]